MIIIIIILAILLLAVITYAIAIASSFRAYKKQIKEITKKTSVLDIREELKRL
jgi:hypothetical protein